MDVVAHGSDNVLSLTSLLNKYYPATTSNGTIKNLESKGIDGLTGQYFPARFTNYRITAILSRTDLVYLDTIHLYLNIHNLTWHLGYFMNISYPVN